MNYQVSYWYAEDGIIEYDYQELHMPPDNIPVAVRNRQAQHASAQSAVRNSAFGYACLLMAWGGTVYAMFACLNDIPSGLNKGW